MKIGTVGAELFHVGGRAGDGRTDRQTGDANNCFSQFCKSA
jgi:hypothetical protein